MPIERISGPSWERSPRLIGGRYTASSTERAAATGRLGPRNTAMSDMRAPVVKSAAPEGTLVQRPGFQFRHNGANHRERRAGGREVDDDDLTYSACAHAGKNVLEVFSDIGVGNRGQVLQPLAHPGVPEVPLAAIHIPDPAGMEIESGGRPFGRINVFPNALDIDAPRLRRFRKGASRRNACVGMGAQPAMDHGLAGNCLVRNRCVYGGDAEVRSDVVHYRSKPRLLQKLECRITVEFQAGHNFKIIHGRIE